MIGAGLHKRRGSDFDADAQALFDRMTTTPTNDRKRIINTFIVGLKDDGNWNELDVLVVLAAADPQASLLDWKNLSDGVAMAAPGFTVDRGATGDGIGAFIDTLYNITTDAVKFTQNNASLGIYTRTNVSANGQNDIGLNSLGGNESVINPRNAAGSFGGRINTDTAHSVAVANSMGLNVMNRTVNNLEEGFKNGVSIGTQADTSQALVNGDFYVLCRNKIGTGAEAFSTRQLALYFFGSGNINHLTLFNRVETYMDSVGAGVV